MALLGIITTASAQYETTKYNNFKVNIFSPIVKTGSFFFERKLNEKSSAQLGAGFTAYKGDGVKVSGLFLLLNTGNTYLLQKKLWRAFTSALTCVIRI